MARCCGGVNRNGHPATRGGGGAARRAGPRPGPGSGASSWANGTRAQAQALARRLLAELSFPPGTKPAHVRSLPPLLPAPEPGIDAAQVSVGIAAYSGTATLVTAYAYATWLPARTAAEHLDPFGFRAVTVGEDRLIPSSRQVTRTFTDPAVIARLAAFVNGLPPAAELTGRSYAAVFSRYTLRFTARDANGPAAVVSTVGCGTDAITVNGKPQPGLWDTHARLAAMARQLLGSAAF